MSKISRRQRKASRQNGALSHGPVTEQGKATSSQNAVKHGLCAREIDVRSISETNRETYLKLSTAITEELAPEGAIEQTLVSIIIHAAFQILRVQQLERSTDMHFETETIVNFNRLARYRTGFERASVQARADLARLQAERGKEKTKTASTAVQPTRPLTPTPETAYKDFLPAQVRSVLPSPTPPETTKNDPIK